jgi:hypothetical protein
LLVMPSQLVTTPVQCPICGQPAVLTVDEFWARGVGITKRVVKAFECPSGCKPEPSLLL